MRDLGDRLREIRAGRVAPERPAAPRPGDYTYYDADYFQNGATRGTAYSDYLTAARSSAVYREIASAIATVFRPARALEVGCATGVVVRRLNELGIEAHGVDVSEWAIRYREHENVRLAGVEALPFPDGHFDFVYSVHALEHVPAHLKDRAFAELRRVCRAGHQFHMLPVIGLGPYVGERAAVVAGLRKDPTHALLEDRAWWLAEFARIGFADMHVAVLLRSEAGPVDLSESQLVLADGPAADALLDRLRDWNADVFRAVADKSRRAQAGLHVPLSTGSDGRMASLVLRGEWRDVEFDAAGRTALPDRRATALVIVDAPEPISLRFCFISEDGAEADLWREYRPGSTAFDFTLGELQKRKGDIAAAPLARVLFGGTGEGNVSVALTMGDG